MKLVKRLSTEVTRERNHLLIENLENEVAKNTRLLLSSYPNNYENLNAATALKKDIYHISIKSLEKSMSSSLLEKLQEIVGTLPLDKVPAIPFNEIPGYDRDCWCEIPLTNNNLFPNLNKSQPSLLSGQLFTSRMVRNLNDVTAKEKFISKVERNKIQSVVILAESSEFQKYAGLTKLEEFYASLNLQIIHRPIVDYSVPKEENNVFKEKFIDPILSNLMNEKHTLVHCAGGSGRTGIVVYGIALQCGIIKPIKWIRQMNSSYVETAAQLEYCNRMSFAPFNSNLLKIKTNDEKS